MINSENNKLIAEFLGYSQPHPFYPKTTYWYKQGKEPLVSLSFHSDWNWLMEVVEQIEKLPLFPNDNSFNVTIGATKYCTIQDSNGEVVEITAMEETKILSVYKAVVEFIKWYNVNKN
ncbi:MAG: hypothetical protein WD512_20300 [Candidatus Paceibacterota bacterium]